jgi:hypothetical protein
MKFIPVPAGNRVFPLIPQNTFGEALGTSGLCLSIIRAYLTIGKEIRSDTLSAATPINLAGVVLQ